MPVYDLNSTELAEADRIRPGVGTGAEHKAALEMAFAAVESGAIKVPLGVDARQWYCGNVTTPERVGFNFIFGGSLGSFNNINSINTIQSQIARVVLDGDQSAPIFTWKSQGGFFGPTSLEGFWVQDQTALEGAHLQFANAPSECGILVHSSAVVSGKLHLVASFMGFNNAIQYGEGSTVNNCDHNVLDWGIFTICKNCVTVKTHQSIQNIVNEMRTESWIETGINLQGGNIIVRNWEVNGFPRPVSNWDSDTPEASALIKVGNLTSSEMPHFDISLRIDNTAGSWRQFKLLELGTHDGPIVGKINVAFDLATFDPDEVVTGLQAGDKICINAMGRRGTNPVSDPGCQHLSALSTWDGTPVTT